MTPILKDHQPNAKGQAMMEGKATAEEQAAKSALGGRTKSIRRKLRRGRPDESGLTTLEWLLIVAAVAGLAALAVVLVQNVVDETAQDISGSSARLTAAKVAAASVVEQAKNAEFLGAAVQHVGKMGQLLYRQVQQDKDHIQRCWARRCSPRVCEGDWCYGSA